MARLENADETKINKIREKVDDYGGRLDIIINNIVKPYVESLDKYISFVSDCLQDGENPPTDEELEDFCMNLSTNIYFASGACEQLGVREDISKEIYKEVYNERREDIKGTVADKDAYAELNSQQEQITNICYSRAYKIMKAKVDNAQEILASCKKVLSRRIQAMALTVQERR